MFTHRYIDNTHIDIDESCTRMDESVALCDGSKHKKLRQHISPWRGVITPQHLLSERLRLSA